MPTYVSGLIPYCTAEQFVQHAADDRVVRQLLSDDTTPVTGDLDDNELLTAILKQASGEVESAACAGQRYVINETRNDLLSLTYNSAEYLAAVVASLAFQRLTMRRRDALMQQARPTIDYEETQKFLERLRLGERVFGLLENHQASALDSVIETARQVEDRRGVTYTASRFFGTRNNRLQP